MSSPKMTSSQQPERVLSRLMDSYLQADNNMASASRYPASEAGGQTLTEDHIQPLILNSNSCVSLEQIIESFNDPIREEHAWAVIYECCKCLQKLYGCPEDRDPRSNVYLVTGSEQIFIHRDGRVHESSFLNPKTPNGSSRLRAISEEKVLEELAIVIFTALDQGIDKDQQRTLSQELENLLSLMSPDDDSRLEANGGHEDDEGIEQDEQGTEMIKTVLDTCASHLSVSGEAEMHYRNVCRALISEALEFSSFLERTKQSDIFDKELSNLKRNEWASLWNQTMSDLRNGVKLKKTDYTKTPIEFALTPYEMLMDDIRSRRYKLNKVMVDGQLPPKLKKDAHDVILDFIRSRPPLKPASRRQLGPVRVCFSSPQELLMESIRSGKALKKTSGPPEPKSTIMLESGVLLLEPPIIVDDYEDNNNGNSYQKTSASRSSSITVQQPPIVVRRRTTYANGRGDGLQGRVGGGGGVQRSMSLSLRRPMSMSCINTSSSGLRRIMPDPSFHKFDPDNESDEDELNVSNISISNNNSNNDQPLTAWSTFAFVSKPESSQIRRLPPSFREHRQKSTSSINLNESTSQSSILPTPSTTTPTASRTSPTSVELSPDEVAHIRSVLCRAKMEETLTASDEGGLRQVGSGLRQDLEKGKICFKCTKVKFNLFNWPYSCRLCHHTFCASCIEKVKIRSDFFTKIPILALTPQSSTSNRSNSERSRTKSVPTFSARQSVADNKVQSVYHLSTLSERLDHVEKIENKFENQKTPKRVSFNALTSPPPPEDSAKGKSASKVRLRRSNTLGRVDTHSQAQALRRPLPENKGSSANHLRPTLLHDSSTFTSIFSKSPALVSNSAPKMEQIIVCHECKEFAEKSERELEEQEQLSDDDGDEDVDEEESSEEEVPQESNRERRLRLTKSLVLG